MKLKSNKTKYLCFVILVFIGIALFCIWQNSNIVVNKITFQSSKILENFNAYKIAHISDLHNKEFGESQDRLLKKIKKSEPDIIVITGDLIDSNNTDIDVAMDLINGEVNICPTFYVSGNHEAWSGVYEELKTKLKEVGVTVLDNEKITFDKNGDIIELIGMSD